MAGVAELRAITVIFWQINLCLVLIRVLSVSWPHLSSPSASLNMDGQHDDSKIVRDWYYSVKHFLDKRPLRLRIAVEKGAALWRS
jgi:hypothetical protein